MFHLPFGRMSCVKARLCPCVNSLHRSTVLWNSARPSNIWKLLSYCTFPLAELFPSGPLWLKVESVWDKAAFNGFWALKDDGAAADGMEAAWISLRSNRCKNSQQKLEEKQSFAFFICLQHTVCLFSPVIIINIFSWHRLPFYSKRLGSKLCVLQKHVWASSLCYKSCEDLQSRVRSENEEMFWLFFFFFLFPCHQFSGRRTKAGRKANQDC